MSINERIEEFLNLSHSPFHVIHQMEECAASCDNIQFGTDFVPGKNVCLKRNGSSIALIKLPEGKINAVKISATHSDSPSFKIKPNPLLRKKDLACLNVEPYGGLIISPWFDRALSFAGRIVYEEDGQIKSSLVDIDDDLLVIPNLCIHMNRDINNGHPYNAAKETLPLFASNLPEDFDFGKYVMEKTGCNGNLISHDLFLYVREKVKRVGKDHEFIMSPRLDDLSSAYSCFLAFLDSTPVEGQADVFVCFDNEEVGSLTKQGASSTFLAEIIDCIAEAYHLSAQEKAEVLRRSFMMSVDNAHANHPNYPEISDATTSVKLNGGIVIKYNANQSYTTDALSGSYVKLIAKEAGVDFQEYTNRSDLRGGSTLGNLSNNQVSLNCADVGMPQLAMHSCMETQGVKDLDAMFEFIKAFYQTTLLPLAF